MPFDAIGFEPLKVTELPTTPRGRIAYLRDFLGGVPDARFNMESFFVNCDGQWVTREAMADCGTAACVAGWAVHLFPSASRDFIEYEAAETLGLDREQAESLFVPLGYNTHPERFTRRAAIHVLDTYLSEGVIDWERAIRETA